MDSATSRQLKRILNKIITNITKHKHLALDIEKRGAQLLDLVNPGFFKETIKAIPYRKIDLK